MKHCDMFNGSRQLSPLFKRKVNFLDNQKLSDRVWSWLLKYWLTKTQIKKVLIQKYCITYMYKVQLNWLLFIQIDNWVSSERTAIPRIMEIWKIIVEHMTSYMTLCHRRSFLVISCWNNIIISKNENICFADWVRELMRTRVAIKITSEIVFFISMNSSKN